MRSASPSTVSATWTRPGPSWPLDMIEHGHRFPRRRLRLISTCRPPPAATVIDQNPLSSATPLPRIFGTTGAPNTRPSGLNIIEVSLIERDFFRSPGRLLDSRGFRRHGERDRDQCRWTSDAHYG